MSGRTGGQSSGELKPVAGLKVGDLISRDGCVVVVMEKPYITTTADLFNREMLVFLGRIVSADFDARFSAGRSGKLVYGPYADVVVVGWQEEPPS